MITYLYFVTGLFACSAIATADLSSTVDKRQDPIFPPPICQPDANPGFDIDDAVNSLGFFCTTNNGIVGPNLPPVNQAYPSSNGPGFHFWLSWNDQGNCPPSQSPTQNDGRDCNTIFHSIVNLCPSDHPMSSNAGGTVTWNCVDWMLAIDDPMPVIQTAAHRARMAVRSPAPASD